MFIKYMAAAALDEFTKVNNVLMISYKAQYHHQIEGSGNGFCKLIVFRGNQLNIQTVAENEGIMPKIFVVVVVDDITTFYKCFVFHGKNRLWFDEISGAED